MFTEEIMSETHAEVGVLGFWPGVCRGPNVPPLDMTDLHFDGGGAGGW